MKRPSPRLVSVDERQLDGSEVVVVLLEGEHGRRAAGATVVAGGRPYAIARAIQAAISDLD
jgi:hypothetical protein